MFEDISPIPKEKATSASKSVTAVLLFMAYHTTLIKLKSVKSCLHCRTMSVVIARFTIKNITMIIWQSVKETQLLSSATELVFILLY